MPYTVTHEGGSVTIAKNQQSNGGSWQLLGTFTMAPGQNHRVGMTDVTSNGTYIIADATRYLPKFETKVATWPISVTSTGSYKVYAKWPATVLHATDAVYSVTHAAGSTPVTVNQRLNGGVWNLLGSFTFNSGGSGYKVELTDAASGKVAADAIYYVKDAAPSGETFTWEPAIPSAGSYTVYARWTANSLNTSAASFSIVHAGGTAVVTANQRINGGSWKFLGSFEFAPNAQHKVILQASADGDTIADAVRLVGSAPAPANVVYIHGDHLGTPQKMTDASKTIAWDRVQDPFGNTHSLSGAAQNPIRFPGQYADDESALNYNYFRDYDPTLGRYIQGDPIGLRGGLNVFAYVFENPLRLIDVAGLEAENKGTTSGPHVPSHDSVCPPNPTMQQCLEIMFGQSTDGITVGPGGFARLMDDASPRDIAAATLPNNVYLDIPCSVFWGVPWLILHEYYHVIKQWGEGMSEVDYAFNSEAREKAASDFADNNLPTFEKCLNCSFPNIP